MRRSEINHYIEESLEFFKQHRFYLPAWGYYTAADWRQIDTSHREIVDNMLGWDITDFGKGEFIKTGLILFTLRNGNLVRDNKPYAEKIMVVRENQLTPLHYHASKMEDIINRGGGNLKLVVYKSTNCGKLSDESVEVKVDGVVRTVQPGGEIVLTPGESICLEPGIYHSFQGETSKGKVLVGEVSMVNDDSNDNYFYEPQQRFSTIIEDVPPNYLLAIDYPEELIRKRYV
jgi:D-lyxose ketol-isomerase